MNKKIIGDYFQDCGSGEIQCAGVGDFFRLSFDIDDRGLIKGVLLNTGLDHWDLSEWGNLAEKLLNKSVERNEILSLKSKSLSDFENNLFLSLCAQAIEDYLGINITADHLIRSCREKVICPCFNLSVDELAANNELIGSACGLCLNTVNRLSRNRSLLNISFHQSH
jgi:hypothetical protein